jgi:hypothetical protein
MIGQATKTWIVGAALFGIGCIAVVWGTGVLPIPHFGKEELYGTLQERQQRETFVQVAPTATYAAIQRIPNAKYAAIAAGKDASPYVLPPILIRDTLLAGGEFHVVVSNLDHYDLLKEELRKYLIDSTTFTVDSCSLVHVLADFDGTRALDDQDFLFGDFRVVICANGAERMAIMPFDPSTVLPFSFIRPVLLNNQEVYADIYAKQMWSEYTCDCMLIMREGGGKVVRPTSYSVCPN